MKRYFYQNTKVIEKLTDYVIKKCATQAEARALAIKLNSGNYGFEGNTPHFFTEK